MAWTVTINKTATKQMQKLPPLVFDRLTVLLGELEILGPVRGNWPNYAKLAGGRHHHCHLRKGKPTYVAVWREDKGTVYWRWSMLGHTKKRPTDSGMVTLQLRVHRTNVELVKSYAEAVEASVVSETRPWREVFKELRPGDTTAAASLRGMRDKQGMTQTRLSALTGIPQRHISEMEHGKRPIGKEIAHKLALALQCDYRLLL